MKAFVIETEINLDQIAGFKRSTTRDTMDDALVNVDTSAVGVTRDHLKGGLIATFEDEFTAERVDLQRSDTGFDS